MLKGKAWFMLTGHPMGITQDLLTSERGLFDLKLLLEDMDQETTYKMLINYLKSARINNESTAIDDPASVAPFTPEAAQYFCQISMGKPRLFNRLGNEVLLTATKLQVSEITMDVLEQGLNAAQLTFIQQAALGFQEERVRLFLQERGGLSDEEITSAELEQLGFSDYNELFPILERLENADLAYQLPQDNVDTFMPTLLPPADPE